MSTLLQKLSSNSKEDVIETIGILRKRFVDMCFHPPDELNADFQEIFEFINRTNTNGNKTSEMARLLVALHALFLFPKPEQFGDLPFDFEDRFLLAVLILMHNMKGDMSQHGDICIDYVYQTLDAIGSSTNKNFYSMEIPFFTRYFAKSMKQLESPEKVIELVTKFSETIGKVKPEYIGMDDLLFIPQILVADQFLKVIKTQQLADQFINAVDTLFTSCANHPSALILILFQSWFHLTKSSYDDKSKNDQVVFNFFNQVDTITKYAARLPLSKHHELHHQFQWFLLFYFYYFVNDNTARTRLLIFICQGLKTVEQIENHRRVCQTVEKFNERILTQYDNNIKWPLFFFISNLQSNFTLYFQTVKTIYGIYLSPNITEDKEGTFRKIRYGFSMQTYMQTTDVFVDKTLYTLIKERQTSSLETAMLWFNEEIDILTKMTEKTTSFLAFHSNFSKNIAERIPNSKEYQSELFYFIKSAQIWTKFVVNISQKLTELKSFEFNHVLFKKNNLGLMITESRLKGLIKAIDNIHASFINVLLHTPRDFINDVCTEMAKILIHYIENDKISLLFFDVFQQISQSDVFLKAIVKYLYSYVSENIKFMLSEDRLDACAIPKVLAFVIRFCRRKDGEYHPQLLRQLKSFQRFILTSIYTTIRRATNLYDVFNTVKTDASLYSYLIEKAEGQKPSDSLFGRLKQSIFFELVESNKFSALPVFLEVLSLDLEKSQLMQNLEIFRVAFNSTDSEIISKAAIIFSDIFTINYSQGKVDVNDELFIETASALVNDLHLLSKQSARSVERILPLIPHIYTNPKEQFTEICGIKYGDVDMLVCTKAIISNYTDSEQNAFFAFQYVTRCIDILKYRTGDFNHQSELIQDLLGLLMKCIVYSRFLTDLERYYKNLVHIVGNLMIKSVSNVFFLEICSLAASNRSQISSIMYKIADSILSYVSSSEYSIDFMSKTLNDVFAKPNTNRLHLLTLILTLYMKYFKNLVTMDYIKLFIYESNVFTNIDSEFFSVINQFFKSYLEMQSLENKNRFIDLVNDTFSQRPVCFPHILCKRIRKMGIPRPDLFIPINTFNNNDDVCQSQQVCFQMAIGVPLNFDDSVLLAEKVKNLVSSLQPQEKLLRRNTLITELVHRNEFYSLVNPNNNQPTQRNQTLPQSVIFFLCNTMTSRITYLSNSAIRKFKSFAANREKSQICASTIDEYCNNPSRLIGSIYSNESTNPRSTPEEMTKVQGKYIANCCFYRRLMKLHPDKIPHSVIHTLMKNYFDFEQFSELERLNNLTNFVQVVKTLTVRDFIQLKPVQDIILDSSNKAQYLERFIVVTMNLLASKQVPYRAIILKYIWKFLSCFPRQTIQIFFTVNLGNLNTVFSILTDCIALDKSNKLFNALIEYLKNYKKYSTLHPSVCTMIYQLSLYQRFAWTAEYPTLIRSMFSKMLSEFTNQEGKYENSYANLEQIANSYIKIIKENATFESIIDFAKLFQNAMFYHTRTYYEFIRIAFEGLPADFWATFLGEIVKSKISLSNTQYYILVSHAILHCGKCDPDFIQSIWRMIFNKTEKDTLCTHLRCFLSLLKRGPPRTSNLSRLVILVIQGMKSGDPQTELYALKICLKLNSYGMLPDVVFYNVGAQLLSYSKYFDDPYKNLYYQFFNMKTELYQNPPNEFIQALVYFTHDKCSTIRDTLILIEVFQNIPTLLNLLPFSVIASLVLFIKKNLEKIKQFRESELNEFDGLFTKCLEFVKRAKPSEREITLFVNIGCDFAMKVLEPLLGTTSPLFAPSEFIHGLCEYIVEERPDLYPKRVFDAISAYSFTPNSLFMVAAACKLEIDGIKDEFIQKSLLLLCEPKVHTDLIFYDYILDYIVRHQTDNILRYLDDAFKWVCKNFNINIRDRVARVCRTVVRVTPSFQRLDKLKYIWDTIVETILRLNQFKCICHKLWISFYIMFIEEVPQTDMMEYIDFIFDRIKDIQVTSNYLVTISYSVARMKNIPVEIKLHFLKQLVWKIDFEPRDAVPDLINEVLKVAEENPQFLPICVEILVILASINTPKMRISNVMDILALLPNDPKDRLQFLIEKIDPRIWNDMYLPVLALLSCEESPESVTLLGFGPMLSKIGSHLLYGVLCRFIDSGRSQTVISTFAERIKNVKSKRMHHEVLVALTSSIISRILPIHPVTLLKLAHDCGLHTAVETVNKDTSIPPRKFQKFLPYDCLYSYSHKHIAVHDAAAAALAMLGKYSTAINVISEPLSTESKFVSLMREISSHMIQDEKTLMTSIRLGFESDELDSCAYNLLLPIRDFDPERRANDYNRLVNLSTVLLRNKKEPTMFIKERTIIALSAAKYNDEMSRGHIFDLFSPNLVKSIDPAFINCFRQITNTQQFNQAEIDGNEPLFLISPKSKLFRSIAGYHKSGLVAVSKQSMEEFSRTITSQVQYAHLDAEEWAKSSTLFYNLCAMNFSHELLQSAIGGYSHVLAFNQLISPERRFEALARLLILIRESKVQNYMENLSLFVKENSSLFEGLMASLVKLCDDDYFYQRAYRIIEDNLSAIVGLAMTLNLNSLLAKLQETKQGKTLISSHQQMNSILTELFTVDIRSRDRQRRCLQLLLLLRSMTSEEVQSACNVTERSSNQDNIAKVIADSGISLKTTDSLLELKAKVEKSDALLLAKEILKADETIPEIDAKVYHLIQSANHVITSVDELAQDVIMLTTEVLWLGDKVLSVKCLTKEGNYKYLLINKLDVFPKYAAVVASQSQNVLTSVASSNYQMFSRQFPPSVANKTVFTGQFAITLLNERVTSLRSVYDTTFNCEPSTMPLQHDGCSLLRHVISSATPVGYLHHRQSYVSAQGFYGARSLLLRTSYPGLEELVICPASGAIVPHISALEQSSSFRLSPNIVRLCGYNPPGVLALSFAAAAGAFVQSYETVCALAEIMSEKGTLEEVVADREYQIEPILNVSPVEGSAIGREEAIQWHKDVQKVIEEAMTEKGQPITAIPWF
ncbi:hypothetical protein TVAG_295140 [Trichomonas vaginalis G3]|uniref:Uncharacterized protein n=1 Tax=Trichomonas vaginalis (strain ATCC PRA-98 / G3) TaxID=412133 RepID=A2DL71_TRIV3|nr:hypothetical protein TVAGG3_0273340 [Trichomonas vaginalis G3]EAY18862.1 hypothetical protein TVAG_295140 [Trichomonas vaginalis G3]KAI5526023.1 hypothetical protein TVAGG3_0273340 [Trichomonas vaginalis G3]|eukprot:XP_001579848.1 hypothetical protein [Trichomonas vaginalis G3]